MSIERVPAGKLLELQRREVTIDPTEEYKLIGVYSFGKGIFHHEPRVGADLGAYRFFAIEPGDLVLSNIQAWEGAIGFATDTEAGAIGTHRFLTYRPRSDRIDANWARWFFLSEPGMALIRMAAPGSTMRNRTLAIKRFEALEIPLPPIEEQLRTARYLERTATGASGISNRTARTTTLLEALGASISARPDLSESEKSSAGWRRTNLAAVMTQTTDQVEVEPAESYPNVGTYSFGRGLFAKPNIEGSTTSAKTLNRIHTGQFIYSRLFAFEGAYGYVPTEFDDHLVSSEFPTFDTDPDHLDARWLANYLRTPGRWAELASSSKGLGVRRQRVSVDSVLAYEVWLPPTGQQRAMVQAIDLIGRARTLQVQADTSVGALVPATLNAAFAGIAER